MKDFPFMFDGVVPVVSKALGKANLRIACAFGMEDLNVIQLLACWRNQCTSIANIRKMDMLERFCPCLI